MAKLNKQRESEALYNLKVSEDELSSKMSSLSEEELLEIYRSIKQEAAPILREVKFPNYPSQNALTLIMLYLFKGRLIHLKFLASVGSKVRGKPQTNWQVRHMASQGGLWILVKGDRLPNSDLYNPSGYHMLVSLEQINPKYLVLKIPGLLNIEDFNVIKTLFGNRCSLCGSKEGDVNFKDATITKLQKGHINPNKPLEKGNVLPQCDYCNRTNKDKFIFHTNGSIRGPNYENKAIAKKELLKIKDLYGRDEILEMLI